MKLRLLAGLLIMPLVFTGDCVTPEGTGGEGDTSVITMVIFLVVIFAIFYLIMIRPQRKRQKEHDKLMQELTKGDKVVTAGGIYGTIESLSDDSVVMKIESGGTVRVSRNSVVLRRER